MLFFFLLVSIFFYYEGNFFWDIIFLRGIIMSDLEKNLEIIMQKMEHVSLHSVGTNHKKFDWKKKKIRNKVIVSENALVKI